MKRTEFSAKDLRERTDEELRSLERQLKETLFKHRLGRATNQLENVSVIKIARRDLARVKTLIRARALGAERGRPETREA
ncbi:MAG: 50S ribosomal protein L29 [Polyangia bacterium]|jgi:large subunit ribosomal protein L29|nr:50S ribosomal protein L29 [Polyangia bacterium]